MPTHFYYYSFAHHSPATGFSLMEMLVALSLFSIILLTLGTGQLQNTQRENHLYFERIASTIAHNAYEQNYYTQDNASINTWIQETAAIQLPHGNGYFINNEAQFIIDITWQDHIAQNNRWHMKI